MLNEADTVQSVLEVELETLRSIYVHELDVKYDEENVPCSLSIQLHPATADKLEEQYVRMTLMFKLPEKYPDVIPEVIIQNTRGLSDEKIEELMQKLLTIAEDRVGSFMLFELIQCAKEQLTAENKPNGECAICLYGFLEGDAFTKTECYHYFHCHCLSRYIEYRRIISEQEASEAKEGDKEKEKEPSEKILCPVCRSGISFTEFGQKFPEPISVVEAPVIVDPQVWGKQKEFDEIYQKQVAQGGIIDLEAENNKFLLEISVDRNGATAQISNKPEELIESIVTSKTRTTFSEPKNPTMPKTKHSPVKSKRNEHDTTHYNNLDGEVKNKRHFNRNFRPSGYNRVPYHHSSTNQSDKSNLKEEENKTGLKEEAENAEAKDTEAKDVEAKDAETKETISKGERDRKGDSERRYTMNRRDRYRNSDQSEEGVRSGVTNPTKQAFEGRTNSNWNRYDSRKNYEKSYPNRSSHNHFYNGPRPVRDNRYHYTQNGDNYRKNFIPRYHSEHQKKNDVIVADPSIQNNDFDQKDNDGQGWKQDVGHGRKRDDEHDNYRKNFIPRYHSEHQKKNDVIVDDPSIQNNDFDQKDNDGQGWKQDVDHGRKRDDGHDNYRKNFIPRYHSEHQKKNVIVDDPSIQNNDVDQKDNDSQGWKHDVDNGRKRDDEHDSLGTKEGRSNWSDAKEERKPKSFYKEKHHVRSNKFHDQKNSDNVPEVAGHSEFGQNKTQKDNYSSNDNPNKFHHQDNRYNNRGGGRYYSNDSRNKRNDYERRPNARVMNGDRRSPSYSSSHNRYPNQSSQERGRFSAPRNYDKRSSWPERHRENYNFSEKHSQPGTQASQQKIEKVEHEPPTHTERNMNGVKESSPTENKRESFLSSLPIPTLPPGFANPSKKVIYNLPSFHSPPPGFHLS